MTCTRSGSLRSVTTIALFALLIVVATSSLFADAAPVLDGGTPDGGPPDGTPSDLLDAQRIDRSAWDAGTDAGVEPVLDAAATPQPPSDVARRDAGVANVVSDAGPPVRLDAGRAVRLKDASAIADARSARDAGADATADPVLDAGLAIADAGAETMPLDSAGAAGHDAGAESTISIRLDAGVPSRTQDVSEIADAVAEPPPTTRATTDNTWFAIKVIAGLTLLLALAYIGGNRRFVRFQERLGVTGVVTAGFPFVALGVLASLPAVGILTEDVVERLRPVLNFGLGWLGFIIGTRLEVRLLERVPKGTAYFILVESVGPFVISGAASGMVMIGFGMDWSDPAFWRDVILLGTAAAMTAPHRFRDFANRTWREGDGADAVLGQFDEFVGIVGLLFITAYFREPGEATWQLPHTAWVFVSLGLGVAVGVLIFALVRVPVSNAEFLAVVLGSIAFASGLAGYLRLSPSVICFIAGVLVTNFPHEHRESIFRILDHLERPVHLLFLIVTGAVWSVSDWRGWILVAVFVAARVVGKWVAVMAGKATVGTLFPDEVADRRLVVPVSSLSIALVINVENLYRDAGLSWVITAVIGGAIITELLVRRTPDPEPHDLARGTAPNSDDPPDSSNEAKRSP